MSNLEQTEIRVKIAEIIERSRHQEERFLIDSKTAAADIINFLSKRKLIAGFYDETMLGLEN